MFSSRWGSDFLRVIAQVLVVTMILQGLQVQNLPYLLSRARHALSSPASPAGERKGEGSSAPLFAEAQAQPPPPGGECAPPDCIPLPSPITLARSLSAFSIDTLSGGQLTITYTIFNKRDEEIGEPLLVTQLAPGVSLVTADPVPDQPPMPDGTLAFVLPNIPPFGEVKAVLTVEVATGGDPVPVEVGTPRAFGNIRTRAVKASLAALALPQTLGVAGDLVACTMDTCTGANTPDRYVLQTIGDVGCDPVALFEFVRDKVGYESYRGSLRGARGTLWSMAGNALDQASLLNAMLRACGIPSRYVSGTLSVPDAQELILSMFPPITRAVGGLPAANLPPIGDVNLNDLLLNASQFLPGADQISDPANDPQLLSETQDHFWVEYFDGSSFVALDPTFQRAAVGQTFAPAGSAFVEVDDAIRHKVEFQLVTEFLGTGVFGAFTTIPAEIDPLFNSPVSSIRRIGNLNVVENAVQWPTTGMPMMSPTKTFRSVELVGEPVSIGHFVDQKNLIVGVANTYSPWMQVGNSAELIRGTDYQEIHSFLGSSVLSSLFLRMRVIDAQGNGQDFDRALVTG